MIDKELLKKLSGGSQREITTERQLVNLIEKASRAAESNLIENAVVPIIEFFLLKNPTQTPKGNWHIFSTKGRPELRDLQTRLDHAHGIYVFHDSSGRAIYAGKALRQTLWSEINHAFKRDRGEVQSIKRVELSNNKLKDGQIKKMTVALHELARYVTAYEIPSGLISKFEALIVRSFANDLLNVRMEKF